MLFFRDISGIIWDWLTNHTLETPHGKNTDKPFDCHSHSQHVMAVHHLSSVHRGIGVPVIHLGSPPKALYYSAVIKLSGVYPHMP